MQGQKRKVIKKVMLVSICLLLSGCGKQPQEVGEVKDVVVIPEKQITAEMGTINTMEHDSDWHYQGKYMIQSQQELELFFQYMSDYELEESAMFSALDFNKETLLIIPEKRGSTVYEYICENVMLKGTQMQFNYTIEGDDRPGPDVQTRYYPYAIVPNSELSEEYYEGWVKPSEVLVDGRITTNINVVSTDVYEEEWKYENSYIIKSENEMQLFLKNMKDAELEDSPFATGWNYDLQTILVKPIQVSTSDYSCRCRVLKLQGDKLILDYTLEEGETAGEGRIYIYTTASNKELTANTYDGWMKPSEVFGK